MQDNMATLAWHRRVIVAFSSEAALSFDIYLPLAEERKKKPDVPCKQRVKQPCAVKSFHSCRGEYDPEYIKYGFIMAAGDAEQRVLCAEPPTPHPPFKFLNKPLQCAQINFCGAHKPEMEIQFFSVL